MHDPMTVAHEIYLGRKRKKNGHYRSPLITIWHVDPEKDGTDDSCGWFVRIRHVPKDLVDKVAKDFQFEFKHNNWFNDAGYAKFSPIGITLCMYNQASWAVFMYQNGGNAGSKARRQHDRFMRKHLHEFLHFAENPMDSLHSAITMFYGVESKEDRINHFVTVVLSDIMRKLRPWYKHPRWHISHWKIQFHPWERLKRRYWDKCCKCGKRGFKGSAMCDWNGTMLWHPECDDSHKITPSPKP